MIAYKLFHIPSSKFVRIRMRPLIPVDTHTNASYRRLFTYSDFSLTNENFPHLLVYKKYVFDILFKSDYFHMSMAYELGLLETYFGTWTASDWHKNPVHFIRDEFDIVEVEIDETIPTFTSSHV